MQKRRDRRLVSQPGPESLPSQLHLPSLKVAVAASSSRRCISITAATSGRRPPLRPSLGHTRYISWNFLSLGALLFAVSLCYSYPLAFFQIPSVAPRRALAFHPNSQRIKTKRPQTRPISVPTLLHLCISPTLALQPSDLENISSNRRQHLHPHTRTRAPSAH